MVIAALTGGIGSGKSTVAALLARRGAVLVDADAIAREVVEPGTPALAALTEQFGPGILAADGTLDRPALARVAFADDASRAALEGITHPAINEEFGRRMRDAPDDAIMICDVPLLVESTQAQARGYQLVIVVAAPRDIRLARLEARGVPRDDAERRMAAQASDEDRRQLATYLIDNRGDLAALDAQVEEVWRDLERR
ncbi:MAG TPA: dephospho-CoA kinase, partial [Acidimicrobiia bacterium]|nr:dephospho-CoA kinase [Acidimicrobiia bacterium]